MRIVCAGGFDVATAPPNGRGLAARIPHDPDRGLPSRNPCVRERRFAAAVGPLARGALDDAPDRVLRGFSLRAVAPATRLLATVRTGATAPFPGRHPHPAAFEIRRTGPTTPPPSQGLPDDPRGRSAAALAEASAKPDPP